MALRACVTSHSSARLKSNDKGAVFCLVLLHDPLGTPAEIFLERVPRSPLPTPKGRVERGRADPTQRTAPSSRLGAGVSMVVPLVSCLVCAGHDRFPFG
jgi:hypothetical protein